MNELNVGVIGTGWCGGIRAVTAANSALVGALHIAETKPERLEEMKALTNPVTATANWEDLVTNPDIQALMISATPETLHYPMAKAALEAGKHVLLEKPISVTLEEADELIDIAETKGLKFTIGYSQRFNSKQALAKRSIADGSLGDPVSVLISRHITRSLGSKVSSRTKLSPAAMEGTHDLDTAFWWLEPRRPVRVYSQNAWGVRRDLHGVPDVQYLTVTMDDGVVVVVGAGMNLPRGYPNFSTTWIEVIGTDGALLMDASHKDIIFNTEKDGVRFPLSTMPGEFVDHVYAGPMATETHYFIDCVTRGKPILVLPSEARTIMDVYMAADLSAERNEPISLPRND
jgi:predicted dehydrogenase